jgi:glycosyltransferase involved in cell wall biosynthesis
MHAVGGGTPAAASSGSGNRDRNVAIVIPALNCETTISEVVSQARRVLPSVFVVDDGSADATARLAAEAGALVFKHAQTLGKGAALLTALNESLQRGFERVVTMDGDGQHLADQIPVLLAASDRNPGALIIGARILEGLPTTAMRRFGNRFANRWVEIACGRAVADTQSGFRVYPVRATLALKPRARRFAFETEVLIRAVRAGIEIESVPTRVYYPPVDERISHFRPVVDTIRIILVVLALIFRLW